MPNELLEESGPFTDIQRNELGRWWDSLLSDDKAALADCSASSKASLIHGTDKTIIGGRFVPHDDAERRHEWFQEHFEYLLSNPEIYGHFERVFQPGGVCTAHENAREALRFGRIPSNFNCPFGHTEVNCPMRSLLRDSNGRDLELFVLES